MAYNASQQKSPVCYDLTCSQWQANYRNFRFFFSTAKHRDKFLVECRGRVAWMNDSMSRRFHVRCDFAYLAVVQLYMQIEGRGFLVVDEENGIVYDRPEKVRVTPVWKVNTDE